VFAPVCDEFCGDFDDMQSDIRREIILAMQQAVRAPFAFCFAASAEDEDHLDGLQWSDGTFTELPRRPREAMSAQTWFPGASTFATSPLRVHCVPVATFSQSLVDGSTPRLPSGKGGLLLYLCLGDSFYGVAGFAREEDDAPFDDAEIGRLEQLGAILSSLAMLYAHALGLQRQRAAVNAPLTSLSEREQQVARLLADGYSCVNTAAVLNLSENTVRTYVRRLYRKLAITNRVDLVQRLIGPSPAHG